MLKALVLAAAVSLTVTGSAAFARGAHGTAGGSMGTSVPSSTVGSGVNVQTGSTTHPYGWSQGRKTGWKKNCTGTNCNIPPGLRR